MKPPSFIVLTGFMGSGKTSTGKDLAKMLQFDFLDTDHWIEEKCNKTIPQIFKEEGEDFFRDQEKKVVEMLSHKGKIVVATGGGLWMDESNRNQLLHWGWCVWLKVSAETAWKRIKSNVQQRPLLKKMGQVEGPPDDFRSLLEKRNPIYQLAHFEFSTDGKTTKQVSLGILKAFKSLNN